MYYPFSYLFLSFISNLFSSSLSPPAFFSPSLSSSPANWVYTNSISIILMGSISAHFPPCRGAGLGEWP